MAKKLPAGLLALLLLVSTFGPAAAQYAPDAGDFHGAVPSLSEVESMGASGAASLSWPEAFSQADLKFHAVQTMSDKFFSQATAPMRDYLISQGYTPETWAQGMKKYRPLLEGNSRPADATAPKFIQDYWNARNRGIQLAQNESQSVLKWLRQGPLDAGRLHELGLRDSRLQMLKILYGENSVKEGLKAAGDEWAALKARRAKEEIKDFESLGAGRQSEDEGLSVNSKARPSGLLPAKIPKATQSSDKTQEFNAVLKAIERGQIGHEEIAGKIKAAGWRFQFMGGFLSDAIIRSAKRPIYFSTPIAWLERHGFIAKITDTNTQETSARNEPVIAKTRAKLGAGVVKTGHSLGTVHTRKSLIERFHAIGAQALAQEVPAAILAQGPLQGADGAEEALADPVLRQLAQERLQARNGSIDVLREMTREQARYFNEVYRIALEEIPQHVVIVTFGSWLDTQLLQWLRPLFWNSTQKKMIESVSKSISKDNPLAIPFMMLPSLMEALFGPAKTDFLVELGSTRWSGPGEKYTIHIEMKNVNHVEMFMPAWINFMRKAWASDPLNINLAIYWMILQRLGLAGK